MDAFPPVKFIVYLSHGGKCRCFSEQDLAVNLRWMIANNERILRVERIPATGMEAL